MNLLKQVTTYVHQKNSIRKNWQLLGIALFFIAFGFSQTSFIPYKSLKKPLCLPDDSLALVELYNATDGANWTTPWDLTQPYDTWAGIVLDTARCVVEVNLSNRNLTGTLPTTMFGGSKLNRVKVVDLSNNKLLGTIPTQFGSLTTLEQLNLSNNDFTGTIPATLASLLSLKRLDLSFNSLTGDFPSELTDIATLLYLEFVSIDSNFIENVPTFNVNRPITINVANNKLRLQSIVPNNKTQYTFTYSPQDSIGAFKVILVPEGGTFRDTVSAQQVTSGTRYRWLNEATEIRNQTDDSVLVVENASIATHQGIYTAEITHPDAPNLTLYRKKFFVNVLKCPSNNTISKDTAVCEGRKLPTITGSESELGEISFFSYKWQQALDGDSTNFVDAPVGNVRDYVLSSTSITIQDTAYFRRILVPAPASGCPADTSNLVRVVIVKNFGDNLLFPSVQSVCLGAIPKNIYGTTSDSSATSPFTYRYQVSLDSGQTWIDSLRTQNFAFTDELASVDTIQFRRIVSGSCEFDTSNVATIFTIPPVVADSIFSSQTICINTQPDTVFGNTPRGGNPTDYKYFWQTATRLDTADWITVDSALNRFIPPVANDTFFIRRIVRSACFADTSNIINIFISPDLGNDTSAISIPRNRICSNDSLPTILGERPPFPTGYRYEWQVSTDSALWTAVDTLQNYDPIDSLLFDSVFVEIPDSFYVRRLVIDSCRAYPSNALKLFMIKPIDSTSNIITYDSTTVCEGDTTWRIQVTEPRGGSGNYAYQWQISFDSLTWADRDDSIRISHFALADTTYFRRLVSDSCRTDTSNVVFIPVVKPFGVNQLTTNLTELCVGDSTKITINATFPENEGTYRYIYQQSPDSLAWFSFDTLTHQFVPDTLYGGTNYFRRIVLGGCKRDTSNTLGVRVILNARNNFIFNGADICLGDTMPILKATQPIAGDGQNLEVIWQTSVDSLTWVNADTDSITTFKPDTVQISTFVRRGVRSGDCDTSYSNVVQIRVFRPILSNTVDGVATNPICEGTVADTLRGSLPVGGNQVFAYTWQSRRANDSTARFRTVGSQKDYFAGNVTFDTEFRRIVRTKCFIDTSEVYTLRVKPTIKNNIIDNGFVDCNLDTLRELQGTVLLDTLGEIGQFTYLWQKSKDRRNWIDLPNTNTPNHRPAPLDTTTFFRRLVINDCFRDSSNIATITIRPNPILTITPDTIIAIGTSVELLATGAINYLWSPAETLSADSIPNPVASPLISTLYTVRGENIYGCVTYDSVFVTVTGTPQVRVVDVITPDGNGLNDEFYIEGIERYPDNLLIVINRWGQEVYRKKGYTNDWKGTYNSNPLPAGTYFYIIKFDITSEIVKGSFELIR